MKVLFVTNAYPSDSRPWEGTAIRLQAEGLRALGAEVHLLHLRRTIDGRAVYASALPNIRRIFSDGRFDVLHAQFGGLPALLSSCVARNKTVITFHGGDLHGGHAVTAREKFESCANVVASRVAARLAGSCILVSRTLLPHLGFSRGKAEVITTGVDLDFFRPMEQMEARLSLGLDPNSNYILFCDNNGDPVKRPDIAESAVAEVRMEFPRAELLVLRHVPSEKVPIYLNAADLLLVTSDKEGSPNIVKEALACNTPIVSVDAGDVAEMISGVRNCHLVQRDLQAIVLSIKSLLYEPCRTDGRICKRHIIDNEVVCRAILRHYGISLGASHAELNGASRGYVWRY